MGEQLKRIDLRHVARGSLFGKLECPSGISEEELTDVLVDIEDYRTLVRAAVSLVNINAAAILRDPIEIRGIAYTPASWGDCTEGLDDE